LFVILDDAQLPKKGGTYGNHVKLLLGGEEVWLTAALDRSYHGVRQIKEVRLAGTDWAERAKRRVAAGYGRAPFFLQVFPFLEQCLHFESENLAEFNERNFLWLVEALDLPRREIARSSKLRIDATATERLVRIVRAVGGTKYVYGALAKDYQQDEKFKAAGIDLVPLDFQHPVYPQFSRREFMPGLSIIDCLMNCGFAGTRHLLLANLELTA